MTNFFRTVSIFYRNPFINPYGATLRHSVWALRRILNLFPCKVRFGDYELHVPNRSMATGVAALTNAMGYYDPNNMFFIEEVFQKQIYENFFDIGSNVGVYSLIATGKNAKQTMAFAFEPHPYTFSLLNENISLNHAQNNILSQRLAFSDQNGTVLFRDKPGEPENRIVNTVHSGFDVIKVPARRGDDYCRELGMLPQVMKIDVEGHENSVLAGFSSILKSVKLLFIECWDIKKTVSVLCDATGFLGPYKVDFKKHRMTKDNIHQEDWVFVNPSAVDTLREIVMFR